MSFVVSLTLTSISEGKCKNLEQEVNTWIRMKCVTYAAKHSSIHAHLAVNNITDWWHYGLYFCTNGQYDKVLCLSCATVVRRFCQTPRIRNCCLATVKVLSNDINPAEALGVQGWKQCNLYTSFYATLSEFGQRKILKRHTISSFAQILSTAYMRH